MVWKWKWYVPTQLRSDCSADCFVGSLVILDDSRAVNSEGNAKSQSWSAERVEMIQLNDVPGLCASLQGLPFRKLASLSTWMVADTTAPTYHPSRTLYLRHTPTICESQGQRCSSRPSPIPACPHGGPQHLRHRLHSHPQPCRAGPAARNPTATATLRIANTTTVAPAAPTQSSRKPPWYG